ncbi:MAG TPA: hypothetical protein V6C84_24475 [Coleofasciculaceae cyanobacterium]|jgi:hypothetical protein
MDRPQGPGPRTIRHPRWPRRKLHGRRALCLFWEERDRHEFQVALTAEIEAMRQARLRSEPLYHSGEASAPPQSEASPATEKVGQP